MIWVIAWIIGLWLVPIIVKPFEADHGLITIGSLFAWTILTLGTGIYLTN